MTKGDILDLHRHLVSIRSVSGQEAEIGDWVEGYLHRHSTPTRRIGNTVIARRGVGPKLLLNSHIDTVPPNSAWTRDPWSAETVAGKLYGLGANDAKASVAAMIAAFLAGGPCELILMLVAEEETSGKGTESAWRALLEEGWTPDGVVVGEPTELQIGIAQKGLIVAELVASGEARHAANAPALGGRNAAFALAEDLLALELADLGPCHPQLGPASLQPTVLKGAAARNQTPAEGRALLDIRTVPGPGHEWLIGHLQGQVKGRIEPISIRLQPYECPVDAAIVRAALRARVASKPFASATMSDQVFFQGVPTIKCGPGVSARSHTANEFVLESEILEGAAFYEALIGCFAEVLA